MSPRIEWTILTLLVVLAAPGLGCKLWKQAQTEPSQLPPRRMSPDTVALEVAVVSISEEQWSQWQQLWHEVDQTHVPLEQRRTLFENGFRVGVTLTQLPPTLQQLVDQHQRRQADQVKHEGVKQIDDIHQRLECRSGKPRRIPIGGTRDSIAWVMNEDGYMKGESRQQALCQMALKVYPQGDGQARIVMTPEIHHGQPKQKIGIMDNAFSFLAERDRIVFNQLQIPVNLSPGQTILVSSTEDNSGLGGQIFGDAQNSERKTRLMLVRLTQTQIDDLFSSEQAVTSMVTPIQ